MGNIPEILPNISFCKRISSICPIFIWIERLHPFSLIILRLEELGFRIKQVTIKARPFHKTIIIFFLSHFSSQLSHTSVIKRLFQCNRNRLCLDVLRHIAIPLPDIKRRIGIRMQRTIQYGFINFSGIYSGNAFHHRIHNNRYGMITDHAVIVLPPKLLDRGIPVIIVLAEHTLDKVPHFFRLNQHVKQMSSPKSIP